MPPRPLLRFLRLSELFGAWVAEGDSGMLDKVVMSAMFGRRVLVVVGFAQSAGQKSVAVEAILGKGWEKARKRKWRLQKTSLFEQVKAGRGTIEAKKMGKRKGLCCVLFFNHRHKSEFWKHLGLALRGGISVLHLSHKF